MFVAVQTVQSGDTIKETYLDGQRRLQVEKGPGTKVGKVEHSACSKRGTHINGRECFDYGTLVWKMDKAKDEMVDWDIDNNVPVDPAEQLLYEIFSDPERLDGALHTLIDRVADGLVSANDVRRSAGLSPL